MKRIFVDTNILIDLIAERKPFSKQAIEIFEQATVNKIKLYASSHSIATTYYMLKKYVDEKELREILLQLLDFVTVVGIDEAIIKSGLRTKHRDYEDALQILAAGNVDKIYCIVTRNIKDFKTSEVPVFSPDELCEKL